MATSPAAPAAAVTRIASRRTRPGQEAAYEALVREMFEQMRQTPGFRHGQLVPPEQPGGLYHVISQFDSEAALQSWNASPKRADIHARMRAVAADEPEYRVLTGLEAWFAPAVVPATMHPPTPAWPLSPGWAFSRQQPSSSGSWRRWWHTGPSCCAPP